MATQFDQTGAAFDNAISSFKDELKDDKLYDEVLQATTIDQVYDAMQLEQAKGDRLRHLSEISPYLNRLSEYAATLEVFMQVKQEILALIWGPIKLLLQWPSPIGSAFHTVVGTIAEIGEILPEFKEVIAIVDQNVKIKEVMVLFYRDILDFYLITLKFFKQLPGKSPSPSLWPNYRGKIKVVMTRVQNHARLMRNELVLEYMQQDDEVPADTDILDEKIFAGRKIPGRYIEEKKREQESGSSQVESILRDDTPEGSRFIELNDLDAPDSSDDSDTFFKSNEISPTRTPGEFKEFPKNNTPFLKRRKSLEKLGASIRQGDKQPHVIAGNSAKSGSKLPVVRKPVAVENDLAPPPDFHLSLTNLVDNIIDRLPLLNKEEKLLQGKTRIRWTCSCGIALYDDFDSLEPRLSVLLQSQLHQYAASSSQRPRNVWQGVLGLGMSVYLLGKQAMVWNKPNSVNGTSNNLPLHIPLSQRTMQQGSSPTILHLLMCIDKGETWTGLHQKRLKNVEDDQQLFIFLRAEYLKYRGHATWFALRAVRRVSLTRFHAYSNNFATVDSQSNTCKPICRCLPPVDRIRSQEYCCSPAPEDSTEIHPVIGSRFLTHYFKYPHELTVPQIWAYKQLPKRGCLLSASADGFETGWGIHFEEGWHWRTVYVLVIVVVGIGSIIFAITWSVTKGSIQDAFTMASTWVTLGALIIGLLTLRNTETYIQ